jgi:ABC-type branched-subunit amino acid transport system permease subunit
MSSESGRGAGGIIDWFAETDTKIIVGTMLAIYVGFIGLSIMLGLTPNGTLNTLQRITFLTAVYALMALALNLHWGYTGLFNIGVAGFMAVGVYTMAMLTGPTNPAPQEVPGLGLPLWVGVLGGMVAAALVGFIAALPALRLKADYLAIVTIALSEIIRITYLSTTFQEFVVAGVPLGTGGGQGINLPTNPIRGLFYQNPDSAGSGTTAFGQVIFDLAGSFGIVPSVVTGWVYALVLIAFVGLYYWLMVRIGNSPFGRVLKAIREDELVADSLGKNTRLFKIKVFMVGCAMMGFGGILWQGSQGFVNPGSFLPVITFYIFVALIIGGAGSNTGAVIGGALFASILFEGPQFVARLLDAVLDLGSAPNTIIDAVVGGPLAFVAYAEANISSVRFMLIGVVLIYLMQRRPEGVLGHRKEIAASVDLSERPQKPDTGAPAGGDD